MTHAADFGCRWTGSDCFNSAALLASNREWGKRSGSAEMARRLKRGSIDRMDKDDVAGVAAVADPFLFKRQGAIWAMSDDDDDDDGGGGGSGGDGRNGLLVSICWPSGLSTCWHLSKSARSCRIRPSRWFNSRSNWPIRSRRSFSSLSRVASRLSSTSTAM